MRDVVSWVRAYATPVCSIHDIAESLASDLLARYPAALETQITFMLDIRKTFETENLVVASCSFSKANTSSRMKLPAADRKGIHKIASDWHLQHPLLSGHLLTLRLRTEECSESTVYNQISGLTSPSFCSSLGNVHPILGLHEVIARFAEQPQRDRAEVAALWHAQYLFYMADMQSPCKRLQNVQPPLAGATRTKIERMVESTKAKFNYDGLGHCSVGLRRHQYGKSQRNFFSSDVHNGRHRAYLALGSNQGNRFNMIDSAVREMSDRGLIVLRTSALYETKPMYLENQESFINGACEVCSTAVDTRPR